MLTPEQLAAARQKVGIPTKDPVQSRVSELDMAWGTAPKAQPKLGQGAAGEFGEGFVRSITAPLVRTGAAIESGLDQTLGRGINAIQGKGFTPTTSGKEAFETATRMQENIPDTFAGQAGKVAGETLPYFLPAGQLSKAEGALTKASQVIPGVLGAGARILGKSAIQAVPAGLTKLAQTGDAKDAAETALGAGVIRGGMATIGEGARALNIPQKLYTTIFKNSKKDMLSELNSRGISNLQKNNPEVYDSLVEQGIIKTTEKGRPVINKTLAEKALEQGLKGSVDNMANTVVKGKYEMESAARAIAKAHPEPIDLSAKQYQNVLRDIADEYADVGFGEINTEATRLADKLQQGQGYVDASTALEIRRFLDKMRFASSFDKPVSKLSTTQANLKTLADAARKEINTIPGMRDVMEKYAFYIDALDALAQEAKRTGNNQVLGLVDSLFLTGGVAASNPAVGAATAITRRVLGAPTAKTNIAQSLEKGIINPAISGALNAGVSGGQSAVSP